MIDDRPLKCFESFHNHVFTLGLKHLHALRLQGFLGIGSKCIKVKQVYLYFYLSDNEAMEMYKVGECPETNIVS